MKQDSTGDVKVATMPALFRHRVGWLLLMLIDIPLLIAQFQSPQHFVRPGLTPLRESLLHILISFTVLAGFWFRWSPMILWPTFATMLAADAEVNGLSASAHTLLFVIVGTLAGAIHVAIRARFA